MYTYMYIMYIYIYVYIYLYTMIYIYIHNKHVHVPVHYITVNNIHDLILAHLSICACEPISIYVYIYGNNVETMQCLIMRVPCDFTFGRHHRLSPTSGRTFTGTGNPGWEKRRGRGNLRIYPRRLGRRYPWTKSWLCTQF